MVMEDLPDDSQSLPYAFSELPNVEGRSVRIAGILQRELALRMMNLLAFYTDEYGCRSLNSFHLYKVAL